MPDIALHENACIFLGSISNKNVVKWGVAGIVEFEMKCWVVTP